MQTISQAIAASVETAVFEPSLDKHITLVDKITALNDASVEILDGSAHLISDLRQWAYSATVNIDLNDDSDDTYELIVRVSVHEGILGIGWASSDLSRWIARKSVKSEDGLTEVRLSVSKNDRDGRLIFENWTDGGKPAKATIDHISAMSSEASIVDVSLTYQKATAAEKEGKIGQAILLYKQVLQLQPSHTDAIAHLGRLRFQEPAQPFLKEMAKRANIDVTEVVVEVRNPCNYRCFYCVAAGGNNEPVKKFDLDAIEKIYAQIKSETIVTSLECGGGEPTVHPQFPELLQLCANYGGVSFPTNNSQNPARWLRDDIAHKLFVRSALHPESEANLDRYLENAKYLVERGCEFVGLFIAHPSRMEKVEEYRDLFARNGVSFTPIAFLGEYEGQRYPNSYNEAEKKMVGLFETNRYWAHQIEPHVTRIRNFRGIPCIAGYRSIYITKEGTILRCLYDSQRILDKPLEKSEACGVSSCGCGLYLDKLNTINTIESHNYWGAKAKAKGKMKQIPVDWMQPEAEALGYQTFNDAMAHESIAMYDALMQAYGKDEFPE